MELSDGTKVHPVKIEALRNRSDGSHLTLLDLGGSVSDADCYWPVRKLFRVRNMKNPAQDSTFVIFKILDRTKSFNAKNCREYAAHTLQVRVESIGGQVLSLDDGTFIVEMEAGVLVRFDQDFRTKSQLINDRYFVLKYTEGSGRLMIDNLTNKNYDIGDIQNAIDDLRKYLIKIKMGRE